MDDYSECYRTLGLEANSSPEQVKQAYRDLVRVWHPDRFSHDERLRLIAQEKLKEINGAYELLKAAFFEASIEPELPHIAEPEPAPNDPDGPGEEPPRPGGKGPFAWAILGAVTLAVIGVAIFINGERGNRKETMSSLERKPLQPTNNIAPTNEALAVIQPTPIAANAPIKRIEPAPPAPVPAPGHYALSLDGNKSHVEIATTGSLIGAFTVECWALSRNLAPGQHLVSSRVPKEHGFDMKFDGDKLHGDIGNGSAWLTIQADVPFKYAKDTWYHIAYVVMPNRYAIYINGVIAASKVFDFSAPVLYDADHQLLVGAVNFDSGCLNGLLADLRIWETARSQLQIRANMNRRLTGTEPGLRGYWPFDEGTGTTAADRTGHGLTGALVEGASWATNAPPLDVP